MSALATEARPIAIESVVAKLFEKNETAELKRELSSAELKAESFVIESDGDYAEASKFARELKRYQEKVTSFWKPKKEAASAAHRQVCEGEKEMLAPVNNAINVIKRAMGDFTQRREQERRAAEAEARRLAEAEAERKLAEAIKAEQSGDAQAARWHMQEAQTAESMSRNLVVNVPAPKAAGVSQSKDWELVSVDTAKTPVEINGVELRPVDKGAVMRLIRMSKGNIKIPGIVYKEITKTSIRK